MKISYFLGAVISGEQQLTEAFKGVSDRHAREWEPHETCYKFSQWSRSHLEGFRQHIERYGTSGNIKPEKLSGMLFQGRRVGVMGLLQDYQDLNLLTQALRTHYTILYQVSHAAMEEELQELAREYGEQLDREVEWLSTQIEILSPQAIHIPAPLAEEAAAVHRKFPAPAPVPDLLWAPIMGGLLAFLIGMLSLLFGKLWLFPSLGPSIFLQTSKPADPSARFYNTAIGHALGALAGFAGVFLFGAYDDPVALVDKQLTPGRMGAAIVAIAFTLLLTLLARADHPPAGATTLLVALGSISSLQDIFSLAAGVLIVALSGELVRLMRTRKAGRRSR